MRGVIAQIVAAHSQQHDVFVKRIRNGWIRLRRNEQLKCTAVCSGEVESILDIAVQLALHFSNDSRGHLPWTSSVLSGSSRSIRLPKSLTTFCLRNPSAAISKKLWRDRAAVWRLKAACQSLAWESR
jgi:hypothetical protein